MNRVTTSYTEINFKFLSIQFLSKNIYLGCKAFNKVPGAFSIMCCQIRWISLILANLLSLKWVPFKLSQNLLKPFVQNIKKVNIILYKASTAWLRIRFEMSFQRIKPNLVCQQHWLCTLLGVNHLSWIDMLCFRTTLIHTFNGRCWNDILNISKYHYYYNC